MKFFYLALLFCISPIVQVNASTPKSVTCTRTEYREEYIPGTKSNPGYVKSYEVDVVIPCGGQSTAEKIDDNDCSDCLLYTSPSPRDRLLSRMPSSA